MTQEQSDRCKQVIEDLKYYIPPQINLAELMCANAFMGSFYGWDDPLYYAADNAMKLLEELMIE